MPPIELRDLIPLVLTSWQVIVTAVVVLLFIKLVSSVAKVYSGDRPPDKAKRKKSAKKSNPAKAKSGPEEVVAAAGANPNEELGLEEG